MPSVFTVAEREAIRAGLMERAQEDARVVAAALTGSAVAGTEDELSDIDLGFGIADGVPLAEVIADWTEAVAREQDMVTHWDLPYGPTTFCIFLLASGLQIDLAFTPAAQFGSYGPNFRLLFGEEGEREPVAPQPREQLVGWAWVFAVHAGRCIERGLPWQAEHSKADCDRCKGEFAHLFLVAKRWLCAYCKNALERQQVRA